MALQKQKQKNKHKNGKNEVGMQFEKAAAVTFYDSMQKIC